MVIFLAITLVSSSFTAVSIPALASSPANFIDAFVTASSGGLNNPSDVIFGPDGNLYVTSFTTKEVLRYDGTTGAFIDAFVTSGSGGLVNPSDAIFGPDGNLYVASWGTSEVLRYDGTNGSFIDIFADSSIESMGTPAGIVFGPDGNLHVSSFSDDQVYRYDGTTGSFMDIFADSGNIDNPSGLVFGPDGNLYVANWGTKEILRYQETVAVDAIPTVDMISPDEGDNYIVGDTITFSGSASDPEDGDVSLSLSWDSNLDGVLGTGPLLSLSTLSVGTHSITSSVIDTFGNSDSHTHTINVNSLGSPTISITNPVDGTSFDDGDLITLSGLATDPEDFDISTDIIWASDIHGVIGSGSSISSSVAPVGVHTVTASVTDSDGNSVSQSITITVGAIVEDTTTLVCHFPPGNPGNFHEIMITPSSLMAHKSHGDTVGKCTNDDETEKRLKILKIKKQREEIRDKNELIEKRSEFKQIKNELKDLKKVISGDEKQRIKTLVDDIKEVIKKLNTNPEYDKEHKKILKTELNEIKREIINEIKSDGKLLKHKIDSKISKLSKSDNPKITAKKMGLDFENGKTQIAIDLSNNNPVVIEQLSSIGKIDAKADKHVQLTIKLSDLSKLRTISGIENIRPPFSAVQFEETLSEGVYFINADLAQFSGITGKGIKAAVLDLAFTDNSKISDNIVEVKSFRHGIGYLPIQGSDDEALHGTAVAEIISDVAPDVQLYLYSMETDIEFAAAVDEAISQKVDIIVMSAGWPNFPTDGTSHITKKIEQAVDNGIAFVVPAGNFANKHWEGKFIDSNFNNWHEFFNSDEGLTIEITEERLAEEKPIIAHLMWDVGKSDVADFELVLVDPLGQIIDYSANEQTTKSDTPFEFIHHLPEIDGIYSIGVLFAGDMNNLSERPSATLEIFSVYDEIEYPITKSSVSVPADATGAIVVGAVNHLNGSLEPFSSQGPTNEGKLAPHVVGPDGVTTLTLDGEPFYGTSATAPYIAGLAALIIQTNPDITPQQLLNKIQQNTDSSISSLQNEFDYAIGYGTVSAIFLVDDLVGLK